MEKRFEGVWRIEEMELWGGNDLDLLGPANITFDDDGLGSVQFVAVVGLIDCHFSERKGLPLIEFSWQGHDDNDVLEYGTHFIAGLVEVEDSPFLT